MLDFVNCSSLELVWQSLRRHQRFGRFGDICSNMAGPYLIHLVSFCVLLREVSRHDDK